MKLTCLNLFFILISLTCFSQQFTLSGTIKDGRGEALPGAGIYVSGYQIATVSDNDGKFNLRLNPGNYDLLIQLIGFTPLNKNVVIADKSININLTLTESVTQLAEVTIKPDPNREHYINMFKDFFIGTTPNSKQCRLLNPNVLMVDYDKDESVLTVKTNQFLIIENKALGYNIKYLLNLFQFEGKSRIIYYEGFPYFEDLNGSARQKKNWEKKRLSAYLGSPQHFFKSLYRKKATEEGFIINKMVMQPNANRPPDSLIKANINRLTKKKLNEEKTIYVGHDDSLTYWLRKKKQPAEIAILSRANILQDTLVKTVNTSIKKINFSDKLFISYTKEKENPMFSNSIGLSIPRPLDMGENQVSTVTLQISPVYFYENGGIYNSRSMLFAGYWAWEKIADSVPMDYIPVSTKSSP
ncbi:carboxypeptidase-like regulatory domain-containing protein [Pedobacter petrophilus]|uniref:Carboxypeptidase-like regulatory domain-containing protein n=1 Tax=Pedobacter petrophilus TaxID=1908241 RepID=A0A7K0FUE2_9SPHI|nr:carboxypeptidase-like regulatory domain-containing protein [Pedobacter petrophilus]MRX74684.1 carboxypeptidase-like regulatory domain-containing protein [Pedobacter petrophilus]